MKIIVIYHKADFDGLFSREIAKRHFAADADYIGWDYGDPLPVIPDGAKVYMIDISVDGLMDLPNLVWIDHHKSAIEKFDPFGTKIPGYRIDGVAACRLAWQWFNNEFSPENPFCSAVCWDLPKKEAYVQRQVSEPYAVQLAGEYDIWDKRNPDADVFQQALRSQPLDDEWWANLLDTKIHDEAKVQRSVLSVRALLPGGRALQFSADEANASLMRDASFDLLWEGLRFLVINKPRGNSRTFAAGVKPEHDALLTFYWLRNKWRVSLYGAPGKPDVDLSLIAVKYGGGGHRQACGFECRELPFQLKEAA